MCEVLNNKITMPKKKMTDHDKTVDAGRTNRQANKLHSDVVAILFRKCPYCHSLPVVFQVPEFRYGPKSPWGWTIECVMMGCMFRRSEVGDQSLLHLAETWNGFSGWKQRTSPTMPVTGEAESSQ